MATTNSVPRNDGLPELPEPTAPVHVYDSASGGNKWFAPCKHYYTADQMYAMYELGLRASPSAAQPLLSREPEPVSNASVTVGGVRGPDAEDALDALDAAVATLPGRSMHWKGFSREDRLTVIRAAIAASKNHAAEVGGGDEIAATEWAIERYGADYIEGHNVAVRHLQRWRTAVLDALAISCQDAPIGTDPAAIIKQIIEWHVMAALDPAVSREAAGLIEQDRLAGSGKENGR